CWLFLLAGLAVDHLTAWPHGVAIGLFALAYVSGGAYATRGALEDLFRHRTVNVDLLMVTAAIGAAIVDSWPEGAILLGLFSASGALEHEALGRTQRAVRALMELSPDVATVVRGGVEQSVPVETLRLGDECLVRPGGRVPVDGAVLTGETTIDQSAITGESIPAGKRPGDRVFAGTINGYGAIRVRVDRLSQESTLAKIVQFVENAQAQKSRTQRFTDRFEGRYAVGVLLVSALLVVLPPLVFGHDWASAFYRAMTLLVVASPCALVISTPASTLSALANAARHGILFKGSAYLEAMGVVQTVAFDKTGTLTHGRPTLTDIVALAGGWSEAETLQMAASAEHLSEHHLAQAIVRAASERGLPLREAEAFQAIPSRGIVARVDGRDVAVGNAALFADLGGEASAAALDAADRLRAEGKSAVFVGDRAGVRGVIAVADTLRPSAPAVIADLKALGVGRTVMLTGDHERVAQAIASRLDVDDVYADLLPEDKLGIIRR
ncbi:MAG TPA: heavy metal translocating P-type ATPase, partial [Thermomicrobiales bacterium]|nr:heavy metal translocating P-type ATPase [Thermomicrobiales bacterium]